VVIAGGPKCESEVDVFKFVYDGIEKGAIGINLGRNVWQSSHPVAVAAGLKAIIHENANVKKAENIFNEVKNKKGR
jgi:3-hydroxy-5-phosphonooxypentane-2,4-dione thiolase